MAVLHVISLLVTILDVTCGQTRCCMPNQWESPIGILEGFFLPSSNTSGEIEGIDRISYDYLNKRVAGTITMRSSGKPISQIKSIEDFIQKKAYIIIDGKCSLSDLQGEEALTTWECIPETANFTGQTYFGGGSQKFSIDTWVYNINGMSVTMTFTSTGCIPVREGVVGHLNPAVDGIVIVSYTGLTLGIRDKSVFDAPANCQHTGQTITVGGSGAVGGIVGRMRRFAKSK